MDFDEWRGFDGSRYGTDSSNAHLERVPASTTLSISYCSLMRLDNPLAERLRHTLCWLDSSRIRMMEPTSSRSHLHR